MSTRPAARRRRSWALRIGLAVLLLYAAAALAAALGLIGSHWSRNGEQAYAPPSAEHWLGTNRNGQDVLARALYATRSAFQVGLAAAIFATALGVALGALAGYGAAPVDVAVSWLADVFDSIPFYLLAIALAYTLPGQAWAMPLAIVLGFWTTTARLVRAELRRLRSEAFVTAARAGGLGQWRILRVQLLPHCAPLALVQASLVFVAAIKTEALLSFLGIGTGAELSWGYMLAQAAEELPAGHWQNFVAATGALTGLVLATGLLADELQQRLDPRRRGS